MNVRSIMNKYKKITEHLFDANADIMFLCETWINPDCQYIFPYFKEVGFELCHKPRDSDDKTRGGVVGILVNRNFKIEELNLPEFSSLEAYSCKLETRNIHDCTLVSLYRPSDL